jgi:hypothetical protein
MMPYRTLFLLVVISISGMVQAQTPGSAERHALTEFDNSYANTLPVPVYDRGHDQNRYGFNAIFEIRVAPGVVKTLDVRQYYSTEQLAVQGFMKVRSAMPADAILVHVEWVSPTSGAEVIGH